MTGFSLSRADAALLVVDVQERLAAAMPETTLKQAVRNIVNLLEAAKTLGIPVLATEQYPKGLGPTVADVGAALAGATAPIAKTEFSCAANPAVVEAIVQSKRRQILVCGMEAHVCVFQTVRDLFERGYQPHVVADAVTSRTEENRQAGLRLMERLGATVTTTETAIFDLLGRAGTPEFKKMSALLK